MKRVTVSTVHREWGLPAARRHERFPLVRLSGRWLQSIGFAPGCKVRIEVHSGALILTPEGAQ